MTDQFYEICFFTFKSHMKIKWWKLCKETFIWGILWTRGKSTYCQFENVRHQLVIGMRRAVVNGIYNSSAHVRASQHSLSRLHHHERHYTHSLPHEWWRNKRNNSRRELVSGCQIHDGDAYQNTTTSRSICWTKWKSHFKKLNIKPNEGTRIWSKIERWKLIYYY